MANEGKLQFKPVEVDFDPETAEARVREIEIKKEEEPSQEEAQEEAQEGAQEEAQDQVLTEESQDDSPEDEQEEDSQDSPDSQEDYEEEDPEEEIVDYNELPESIQAALDFMEETGGSLLDFLQVNQDFSKLPQDEVIGRFLKTKYPTLDSDDIAYEIESRFGTDEDDSESDIRRKAVEKKKFYAEALESLKANADKYRTELGSSAGLSAKAQEAIHFQEQFQSQQQQSSKQLEAARSSFIKETNKVFGKNFKGFEVKVGDKAVLYKPENVTKLKEQNLDVNNLLGKFLDKSGNVTDVQGYHRMAAIASDPDTFAQHFFELGRAAMLEEQTKEGKNIKEGFTPRQQQPNPKVAQPKFRFLDSDSDTPKGKIKLRNY